MSSSSNGRSSVNSNIRSALLCAALGTTALTALIANPDTAYADCVAAGGANAFNIDNSNNATALDLSADCPGVGVGVTNTATVLAGTALNTAATSIVTGAQGWEINNLGSITAPNNRIGIQYTGADGVIANSGTIIGGTAVQFAGGNNISFTNEQGGMVTAVQGIAVSMQGTGVVTNRGTITNNSALQFDSLVNIVGVGGTVDNSGSLIATTGRGVILQGGAGATVVNREGASITVGSIGVQFGNAGTLINAGTVASTTAGIAFAGSAGDDTVELHTTGVFNGNVLGSVGTDTLQFGGTGAGTFNLTEIDTGTNTQKYQSFETFTVTGGEWTFNNTTTVPVTINGGTVKGTGTFGGIIVSAGSTLAPGNSIGTQNVAGNVVFAPGSIYQVEINENGTSDLIAATGTATINGGTVQLLPEAGTYATPQTYTILTATGGVTGVFTNLTVANNFAFLNPTLVYGANNVQLTIERTAAAAAAGFGTAAFTRNQQQTAAVLTGLSGTATGTLQTAINNLTIQTGPGARSAFESLSGEIHVAGASAALLNINHVADTMRRGDGAFSRRSALRTANAGGYVQLAQATLGNTATDAADILVAAAPGAAARNLDNNTAGKPWTYWTTALGSTGQIDSDSNGRKTDYNQIGFAAGAEYRLSNDSSAGLSFAYLTNDADLGGQDMDRNAYLIGATGRHSSVWGIDFEGSLGYGYQDVDTTRNIAVGNFAATANANYDAHSVFASVEASTTKTAGHLAFRPFAGATYVYTDVSGFSETGAGTAGLVNDGEEYSSLVGRLGMEVSTQFEVVGRPVIPNASVAWARELGDVTQSSDFTFVGGGGSFESWAPARGRDSAEIGIGVAALVANNVSAHLGYQGTVSNKDQESALSAGVRFQW